MAQENPIIFEPGVLAETSSKGQSGNILLILATPLIGLLINLKNAEPENNKEDLSDLILQIFHYFNQKAQMSGYPSRTILAAQYCLCTALDEVIMNTQWGRENKWKNQSLLSILYKETFGGERFYLILENMLSNPQENIDLLELIYVLLSLGFKGKYYSQEPLFIEALRNDLFTKISPFLKHEEKKYLMKFSTDLERKEKKIPIPLWVIFVLTILAILTIMIIHDYGMHRADSPIFNFLAEFYAHFNSQGNN